MHLFKSGFSFAWISFLLAESLFWRENLVLSLCLWIFSRQIKARSFYVRAFSTCTICYFPSRRKTPLAVVCLAEWSSFKTSFGTWTISSLGCGVEESEGLPQGCAHVCSHCAKGNLRVHGFGASTVTSSSFILNQTPGGSDSPAVLLPGFPLVFPNENSGFGM